MTGAPAEPPQRPPLIRTRAELLQRLRRKPLVLVDGRMGAGKTWFAKEAAPALGATHIPSDGFLRPPADSSQDYLDRLDLAALAARGREERGRGQVLLDGICALDIARRLGLAFDAHVLVANIDPASARFTPGLDRVIDARHSPSHVHDGALLDDRVQLDDALARLESEEEPLVSLVGGDPLRHDREVLTYFKRFRPHWFATAVFLRQM